MVCVREREPCGWFENMNARLNGIDAAGASCRFWLDVTTCVQQMDWKIYTGLNTINCLNGGRRATVVFAVHARSSTELGVFERSARSAGPAFACFGDCHERREGEREKKRKKEKKENTINDVQGWVKDRCMHDVHKYMCRPKQ